MIGLGINLWSQKLGNALPLLYDTFTDANGTDLTAHTPDIGPNWQGSGQMVIESNQAQPATSGNPGCYRDAAQSDVVIDVLVNPNSNGSVELWTRETDNNNRYEHQVCPANSTINIYRKLTGTYNTLATKAYSPFGSQIPVKIVCKGPSMTLIVNAGVLGSTKCLSAYDTTFQTSTKFGIGGNNSSGSTLIDNHKVRSWPTLGTPVWIFPTFTDYTSGGPDGDFRILVSPDAINWEDYPTVYTPDDSNKVTDTSLYYDGTNYRLVHTSDSGSGNTYFALASGTTLSQFTPTHHVDCSSVTGIVHAWHPNWFIDTDASKHVTVAIATSGDTNNQPYEVHPTNAGMTTWSNPSVITGSGIPSNVIDWFQCYQHSQTRYVAVAKDETAKYIVFLTSSSPFSGWTMVNNQVLGSGSHAKYESPSLINMGGNHWRLYADQYSDGSGNPDFLGMSYWDSYDDLGTFSGPNTPTSPYLIRSGIATQYNSIGIVA